MDRSSLAKVETGDRRVTAIELARVAAALSTRIEWFIDRTPNAIVSHRNATDPGEPSPRIDTEVERRVHAVEFVAQHDAEFKQTLTTFQTYSLPNEDEIDPLARRAREMLGVAQGEPLIGLASKVVRAGVIPFAVDLGRDSADAASVLLESGAVAVINSSLRIGRRRLSLAHELGHVLMADEYTVDWRVDSGDADHREQVMDRFARSLLLPQVAVEKRWSQWIDDGLRIAAVRTASQFQVDMSTLARRLLDLHLISNDQASDIRGTRTTRADIVEYDLVIGDELTATHLPRDYEAAVLRLFKSETISKERALDLLFGMWDSAELPTLSKLPKEAIWQFVS